MPEPERSNRDGLNSGRSELKSERDRHEAKEAQSWRKAQLGPEGTQSLGGARTGPEAQSPEKGQDWGWRPEAEVQCSGPRLRGAQIEKKGQSPYKGFEAQEVQPLWWSQVTSPMK